MTPRDHAVPYSVREAELLKEHSEFEKRVLREGGVTNVAPITTAPAPGSVPAAIAEPTADDRAGIVWWNGLTAADRRVWFARSGCASAADAWACYKTWGEVEVIRNDPSHTLDLSVELVTMEDSAEVAAIVNQIEDHPALFVERFLALERRVSALAAREVL